MKDTIPFRAIFQVRKLLRGKQLVYYYRSYIEPIYTYGILTYGSTDKKNLISLEQQQRKILRVIFNKRKFETLSNKIKEHKISTIRELYLYELWKLLIRILRKQQTSESTNDIITQDEMKYIFGLSNSRRSRALSLPRKLNKQIKKTIRIRVRLLCNTFLQLDKNILEKSFSMKPSMLRKYNKKIFEAYIKDNKSLNLLFW